MSRSCSRFAIFSCADATVKWLSADYSVFQIIFFQALFNLLSNACKFTEDGVVKLEVSREADGERARALRGLHRDRRHGSRHGSQGWPDLYLHAAGRGEA